MLVAPAELRMVAMAAPEASAAVVVSAAVTWQAGLRSRPVREGAGPMLAE
jgi:hypothetical protein